MKKQMLLSSMCQRRRGKSFFGVNFVQDLKDRRKWLGPAGSHTMVCQQTCYGFAGGAFVSHGENVIAPSNEVLKASPVARLKLFDR